MRIARSLLFVPGDRPARFEKALASGAHEVIVDLEDAVAPEAKPAAREAAAAWLGAGRDALVRINAMGTEWYEDDLRLLARAPGAAVMLPKADEASLRATSDALPGRRIVALIETVRGYLALRALVAVPGVARLAFGSVDFSAETGIADEGGALLAVRTQIVLASCHAGLAAPVDGVSTGFADAQALGAAAAHSRALGFGGKLCIHPAQVAAVNAAFRPSAGECDWARQVVEAFAASGGAATAMAGKMIDKPVVERARRILAESGEGDIA
ncbi:CoA ester lyase [Paraburkholderia sp. J11-2]|uniref:HpcH/HpaI aldolase/citrate lyase family protein n=1 Tax=Paraburkholderia sp. J11-2 TaxID=2805431 RepID=UPI002AB7C984|nr:CoA ester lyase [Paraburkholderia sp. J11-2]